MLRITMSVSGEEAAKYFTEATCRCALLGVSAVAKSGMLFTLNPEDKAVYASIFKRCQKVVIVAEIGKLLRQDTWSVGNVFDLGDFEGRPRDVVLVTNSISMISNESDRAVAQETLDTFFDAKPQVKIIQAPPG